MWLSTTMRVGLSFVSRKVLLARGSILRSLASLTRVTSQPYPTNRVITSSLNDHDAGPSSVTLLLSYIQHKLLSLRCPARDAASAATPSIRSPSPQMV